MAEELKPEALEPCPWCGEADRSKFTVDKAWHNTFVRCWKCNATGPWQYGDMDEVKSAIAAWNRRFTPASVSELVAAAKEYREYQRQRADWSEKPNEVIARMDAALAKFSEKKG